MAMEQQNMFLYSLQDISGGLMMTAGASEEENSSTASDTSSSQNTTKMDTRNTDQDAFLFQYANRKDLPNLVSDLKFTEFPYGLESHLAARSKLPNGEVNPLLIRALTSAGVGQARRPRSGKKPIPVEQKDAKYFERRVRNNYAAKKSRDTRKQREDEIAMRASQLETENAMLKAQLSTLREESESLKQMWLQKVQKRQIMHDHFTNSQSSKLINDISSFRFLV